MGNVLSNKKKKIISTFLIHFDHHVCIGDGCVNVHLIGFQKRMPELREIGDDINMECYLCSIKKDINYHHCIVPMKNKYMNICII